MSLYVCLPCQQYNREYKVSLEVHKRKIYLHFTQLLSSWLRQWHALLKYEEINIVFHPYNSEVESFFEQPIIFKKCSTKVLDQWRGMVLLNLINLIFRWSFGCLLAEVLSGTKMFSATDKMASVLKPHQLLEMRLGATEMQYDEKGHQTFFSDAKDLIMK